jgi:hypothetical protein
MKHNFIKYKDGGWWLKVTNKKELQNYIGEYSYEFMIDRYLGYLKEYGTLYFNRCGGWNYGIDCVVVNTIKAECFPQ